MRAAARERWPELSDNELAVIDGHRDMLVGALQEHYLISREEAERHAARFEREWSDHAALA
ncbi:MAG TPA: CsbD family protein [Verrucomicrobiae bacterium]|nr:CsbD family protein [Verrucomicrobiae bacterium]